MTILEKIIANKRREVADLVNLVPIKDLEKRSFFLRDIISMSASLTDTGRTGIIAEFKRRSPSKGNINSEADVAEVTKGYFREGAAGVSVLTDHHFFGGSSEDLYRARMAGTFPILRKDFIIDEYQIIESRALGADVVLLIAAALQEKAILNLAQLANSIGMEVLLEIHNEKELQMVNPYINIIGVNNRNLKTFKVEIAVSERLASFIPVDYLKISESGISSPVIIRKLKDVGYNGFLIGEKFMGTSDPVVAFTEFVEKLK